MATPADTPAPSLPKTQPIRPLRSVASIGVPSRTSVHTESAPNRLTLEARSLEAVMRNWKCAPIPALR
ncbi:MAG: hypothetical protein NT176_00635, partial [Proteobacteria bacterium]|nr:hypothetical protein [Pseudomonadota bacterium]